MGNRNLRTSSNNNTNNQTTIINENNLNSNNKNKKNKRNLTSFASYFYLAGKRFDDTFNGISSAYLFGDKSDLNFLLALKPAKFPTSTTSVSTSAHTTTNILKSLIHIRKDSLRLVKLVAHSTNQCSDNVNKYNIEFVFDADVDVRIKIVYFAFESFNNGLLSYKSACAKQCIECLIHGVEYKKGVNQLFQQTEHFIVPSNFNFNDWQYDPVNCNNKYPIAIVCEPISEHLRDHHCHVTLATLDQTNDGNNFCIKALKQKQCINGLCYLLQEIYGIEKKASSATPLRGANLNSSNCNLNVNDEVKSEEIDLELDSKIPNTTISEERLVDSELQQGIFECVICMSEIRDTLILPCKHLCLCKLCANNLRIQSSNCPICRIPFSALLHIELKTNKNTQTINDSDFIKENNTVKTVSIYEAFNGSILVRQNSIKLEIKNQTKTLKNNNNSSTNETSDLNKKKSNSISSRRSTRKVKDTEILIVTKLFANNNNNNEKQESDENNELDETNQETVRLKDMSPTLNETT